MSIRIAYIPFYNPTNAYCVSMKQALSMFGAVESVVRPRDFLCNPMLAYKKFDLVFLNWIENNIVNKNGRISPLGVIKYISMIAYARWQSRNVVFVRHNNFPHNCVGSAARSSRLIIDISERFFDLCITHSGHNVTNHRKYLPHPLYDQRNVLATNEREYYVIFGVISRYKGIHKIIRALDSGTSLLVMGACHDQSYLDDLKELSRGKSVEFSVGFIEQDVAIERVAASRGLVLPHHGEDMIVSGSYYFAASLGVPVYAINSPFFTWMKTNLTQPGIYTAESHGELAALLRGQSSDSAEDIFNRAQVNFGEEAMSVHLRNIFEIIGFDFN